MSSKAKARAKTIGLWVLTTLLVLLFAQAGIAKFTLPVWTEMFGRWGYSSGFQYFIGVVEILGAVGLLIPRTAAYAAAGLIVIMIGAMVTHLIHSEMQWSSDLIFALLLGVVLYVRRPAFLRKATKHQDLG